MVSRAARFKKLKRQARNERRRVRIEEAFDPVFFLYNPAVRHEEIMDASPRSNPLPFIQMDGQIPHSLPERFIGAPSAEFGLTCSGTIIPTNHFKPLVQRLMDRGEITTYSTRDTIRQVTDVTNRLIPNQSSDVPRYKNAILEHGEHFSPLIAIREKTGRCNDWAAVFAAIGRNAGLNVEVRGDPRFFHVVPRFRNLPVEKASHVWPVVVTRSGERIPINPRLEIPGVPREADIDEHMAISRAIDSGNYPVYSEHKIPKPLRIPSELAVNRPDVFGD